MMIKDLSFFLLILLPFFFFANYSQNLREMRHNRGGENPRVFGFCLFPFVPDTLFRHLFRYQLLEIVIYNLTLYRSIVISNIVKWIPKTPSGIWECTVSWEREKRYSLPLCLGSSHQQCNCQGKVTGFRQVGIFPPPAY